MGNSVYSFGEDSPLKFQIPDKMAKFYNEAALEYFKAQQRFNQKYGRKWNPDDTPVKPKWNRNQKKAWNDFAKIFGEEVEKQGPVHANDIMGDFLVKNAASVVAGAPGKIGRIISLAVAGGVLYGLLNGRERHG